MRELVTGATGFLGSRLLRKLRERGDDVVAFVRDPARARGLDAELVVGDLTEPGRLREALSSCDAAFHVAAVYKVGIPESERPARPRLGSHRGGVRARGRDHEDEGSACRGRAGRGTKAAAPRPAHGGAARPRAVRSARSPSRRYSAEPARADLRSDGVTYWASDAKARQELGYGSRSLPDGLRLTV